MIKIFIHRWVLPVLFILSSTLPSFSQKEANIWCFGDNAGIDFNSGSPVFFPGVMMNQLEGCSSIADANGNLLFYTDGVTVWNRSHAVMLNGTGLLGDFSATQSALIVKQPGNTNIYYVFTTGSGGSTSFCYSIVDMTLGAGLGGVSSKNVLIQGSTDERVAAVRHSNGADVWIITTQNNCNTLLAYLLTSSSFNATPVTTSTGLIHVGGDFLGYLKASPAGNKLAVALHSSPGYDVYDFNNSTGVVSNPVQIYSANYYLAYGVEFSPDGSKLYGSEYGSGNLVYQFNLLAGNASAIINSATVVGNSAGPYAAALQLAPDHKIYLSREFSSYLGVINNPNLLGAACNFVDNGFYLSSGNCQGGLPNLLASYFSSSVPPPVAAFTGSDTIICENDCIDFTNLSSNGTSWQWTFDGAMPSSSTDKNPQTVCYLADGLFNVKLVATNSGGSDSVTFTNYINVKSSPPTPSISQNGTTLFCSTDPSYTSYQWYDSTTLIPGATDTLLIVTHSGNYNIRVANNNDCKVAVGINIFLGIEHNSFDNMFSLYPNPAANQLTIRTSAFHNEAATVSIVNMLGQDVSTPTSLTPALSKGEGEAVIDVSSLPAGIYFLQLKSASKSAVKKFVKE